MAVNILYVNGGLMNRGGVETFMMNYIRHMDTNKVHIDVAVKGLDKAAYDEELEALGCKLYRLPEKSKHPIAYQKKLSEAICSGQYEIVHSHADAMGCWVLKIAEKCGVPIRIAHSHNTQHLATNPVKFLLNELARKKINKYATDRFACSNEAGKWLFGEAPFKVIHNAIDSKQFAFDIDKRQAIRNQYGISENTILLGHVGRFDNQKNHAFLISVFTELVKNNDNYKLMCIGDGWLREDIEKQIKENDLKDKVILAGWQENAGDFYNAFDLYVFPSLFEGLSFVLIEAQANGLACVCSDQVPQETNLSGTEKMRYLPLDKHVWVESLLKIGKPDRYDGEKYIIEQGYDIVHEARKLENIYIEMVRG